MENKISFRLAEYLFKNAFPVYKVLYKRFKFRQDADEIAYLKKEIRKGDIVLDIGSNIGFYAEIISDLVGPEGKVHCFEPDRTNFAHLTKRVGNRKNVVLNNAAVSDKPGKLTIYTSHRLNVDHRTYKPEEYDSSYEVNAINIDDYLKEHWNVNFIKIDIQGYEMAAFIGMKQTLEHNSNLKILTEFWPHGLRSAGSSAEELLLYMKSPGFTAYLNDNGTLTELTPSTLSKVGTGENDFCNVVFKN